MNKPSERKHFYNTLITHDGNFSYLHDMRDDSIYEYECLVRFGDGTVINCDYTEDGKYHYNFESDLDLFYLGDCDA